MAQGIEESLPQLAKQPLPDARQTEDRKPLYLVEVYRDHGCLSAVVAVCLALPSLPLWPVFWLAGKSKRPILIDLAHLASFAATLSLLAFLPDASMVYWIWPTIRVSDTVNAFFKAFARNQRSESVLRSVVLLFIHYSEVVLLFALVFLFIQAQPGGCPPFLRNGTPAMLTKAQAVYYSFVTAATIGFGDITPNHEVKERLAITLYALIALKTFVVLGITLVEFGRLMGGGLGSGNAANASRQRRPERR